MASSPERETAVSAERAEVKGSPPSIPPSKESVAKSSVDPPSQSPIAETRSLGSSIARDDTASMRVNLITECFRTSNLSAGGDDTVGGDRIEHTRRTGFEAEEKILEVKEPEGCDNDTSMRPNFVSSADRPLPVTTTEGKTNDEGDPANVHDAPNAYHEAALDQESCEDRSEGLAPTKGLLAPGHSSKGETSDNKDNHLQSLDDTQEHRSIDKTEIVHKIHEGSFEEKATTVNTPEESSSAQVQPLSVPPHMRSTFTAAGVQNTLENRVGSVHLSEMSYTDTHQSDWPAQMRRAPRASQTIVAQHPSRPPLDYEELRSTKAQLMKVRNDLEFERRIGTEMRKTIQAEKEASIGAAMSDMLAALLQKQAEALTAKAKAEEKERDLQYREQRITQLEVYLSEGQKALKYQLEQRGVRSIRVAEEANLRREIELQVKHDISDIEGKITIQVERLRHQEAVQKIREQQYKVLIRDALENEVREQLARDMQAKASDSKAAHDKAAEAAYERGFAEGEKARGARASKMARKEEFLKGYAACHRSQTALHNLRSGRIVADNSELAFLYDPTHAENLLNIGVGIGFVAAETPIPSSVGVVFSRTSMAEDAAHAATVKGEPQAVSNAVSFHGNIQAQAPCAEPAHSQQTAQCCPSLVVDCAEPVRPAQQPSSQPLQQEELVRR